MPKGIYERTAECRAKLSAGHRARTSPRNYTLKSCGKRHPYCNICRPDVGRKIKYSPTGFKLMQKGYVYVRIVSGWVMRSRAVWTQHFGPIPPGYHVHHRNEIKDDDQIENLRCVTYSEHRLLHNKP